jgi:hypothetical protein
VECTPVEPELNLLIKQGTSWGWEWDILDPNTGDPLDLTDWTVKGQVRESFDSPSVLYEWSTEAGNAIVSTGKVEVVVNPDVSAAWTWRVGRYDIELTNPAGKVARISQGSVKVSREVTR